MIRVRGVPLYWGIERDAEDHRFLTYSVLHEVEPPFRHSTYGIRLRLTPWHWLHVGKFLYDRNPAYYSLRYYADQIGRWGAETPPAAATGTDPAGCLDDGRPDDAAGDVIGGVDSPGESTRGPSEAAGAHGAPSRNGSDGL